MERSLDRDLLFGLIALRNGLIGPVDLHSSSTRSTGLLVPSSTADRLVASGALDTPTQSTVEAMIDCLLQRYEGNTWAILDALDPDAALRETIAQASGLDSDTTLNYAGSGEDDRELGFVTSGDRGEEGPEAGRYHELGELGRGGLGIVYRARDRVLRRDVALKRIRDRRADDEAWQHRFRREAELTGGLQHPGIVPIYDLGTDRDGRPYYVMRNIEGQTFGALVADFHAGRAGRDSGAESLGLRRLLRHFLDLCNAIDYAHGRGILHRDIKPDNVLVGRHGETIVVDWGLAKSLGPGPVEESGAIDPSGPAPAADSAATKSGSVYGTPAYMAPEQAGARPLGRTADVYALGATLYHLLAGRAPFRGPASEVLEAVRLGEFAPPRHHDPTIDRALEAVCLKAMALRPEDRYSTAAALADDVERWLADEPVIARPDPWTVRATRWARRHRPFVSAAAATIAVAVVGQAIFSGLIWAEQQKTEAARLEAIAQKGRAEVETDRAEAHFGIAWDMASDLHQIVELNETGLSAAPASFPQRQSLLDKALTASRAFHEARPDDPRTTERLAHLLRAAANLARFLQDGDRADEAYREAIRLYERLAASTPDNPEASRRVVLALSDRSAFLARSGRFDDAAELADRAIAIAEAEQPPRRWVLALALQQRGNLDWSRERYDAAAASLSRATGLIDEMLVPGAPESHSLAPLFRAMVGVGHGMALHDGAGPGDAAAVFDAAVARFEALVRDDEGADVLHNAAIARLERARASQDDPARWDTAVADATVAVERWEALAKRHRSVPRYQERLGEALALRGRLRNAAVADEATRLAGRGDLARSKEILEKLVEKDKPQSSLWAALGEMWIDQARLATTPEIRLSSVRAARSSIRSAAKYDPENPRYPRRFYEIESEWPREVQILLDRKAATAATPP